MKQKVDYEMNILRTLAILLVVLLHINAPNIFGVIDGSISRAVPATIIVFISVFTRIGVPLFVMISGRYLLSSLKNTTIIDFYKKRIPRLILPLIVGIIIYCPIYLMGIPGASIGSYLKDVITGFAFNNLCVHMWYMYMLIILYLVAPFIYKLLQNKSFKTKMLIGIGLCIFGMIVEIIKKLTGTNMWVFWWMEFIGLFTLGYVLKDIKAESKKWIFFIIAIIVEIISTFCSIVLIMNGSNLGMLFHLGVVPNAQITTILVYLFFNALKCKDSLLSKVSKYSLGVYLYHPIVVVTLVAAIKTGIVLVDIVIGTLVAYVIPLTISIILYKIKPIRKLIS